MSMCGWNEQVSSSVDFPPNFSVAEIGHVIAAIIQLTNCRRMIWPSFALRGAVPSLRESTHLRPFDIRLGYERALAIGN